MTLGSSHVHKARTIINSKYAHKDLLALSGWSKGQVKKKFESAIAISKLRDHRTYAKALLSKKGNAHKGGMGRITDHHTTQQADPNALKQLVVNTDFNTPKVKGSIVNINKPSPKTNGIHTEDIDRDISNHMDLNPAHNQSQGSTIQVRDQYPLLTSNRFQVLDGQTNIPEDLHSHSVGDQALDMKSKTDVSMTPIHAQSDPNTHTAYLCSIPEYQKCKDQIGTKFGCVPLAPIYVYKGPESTGIASLMS